MLLIMGPLLGHGFITAVDAYAEASGIGGGPSALAQGLNPLDGIFVPAFGAYDLAVTFLFPFVAIRLVSGERESGAWKLMAQSEDSAAAMMAAKGLALAVGMFIVWMPGLAAIVLWKIYGGAMHAPELFTLLLGHLLRTAVSAGVAVAAAAIAKNPSSAAIATLGFTVGTWALDFAATGRGGLLQTLTSFTPSSALRVFEQGELQLSTVAVSCLVGLAGFTIAAISAMATRTIRWRATAAITAVFLMACVAMGASFLRPAWDLSENRRNSFSAEDQAALDRITSPLRITVYLAPEDPRLMDLERNVLSKLQRALNHIEIEYAAKSQTGLFEAPGDRYGEIWYEMGGRKSMSRSATEPIVLDNIFQLAGVSKAERKTDGGYPGHPLAVHPAGANVLFYLLWPIVIALSWRLQFRNQE